MFDSNPQEYVDMYFVYNLRAPGWSRGREDFCPGIRGHILGQIKYKQLCKEAGKVSTVQSAPKSGVSPPVSSHPSRVPWLCWEGGEQQPSIQTDRKGEAGLLPGTWPSALQPWQPMRRSLGSSRSQPAPSQLSQQFMARKEVQVLFTLTFQHATPLGERAPLLLLFLNPSLCP